MRLRSPWPGGAGVKPHQSAPRPHAVPPTHSRDTTKENTATSDHRHRVRPNLEAAETAELQLEPPRAGHLPRGGRGSHTRWHRHRPFSWGALSSGTRRPCPRFHRGVRIPGSQGDPHLYGGRHTSTHSTRTHTHTCMCTCTHGYYHTCACTHTCAHMLTLKCMYTPIPMHAFAWVLMFTHTWMCTQTSTHMCLHVLTHMDIYVHALAHRGCPHTSRESCITQAQGVAPGLSGEQFHRKRGSPHCLWSFPSHPHPHAAVCHHERQAARGEGVAFIMITAEPLGPMAGRVGAQTQVGTP